MEHTREINLERVRSLPQKAAGLAKVLPARPNENGQTVLGPLLPPEDADCQPFRHQPTRKVPLLDGGGDSDAAHVQSSLYIVEQVLIDKFSRVHFKLTE